MGHSPTRCYLTLLVSNNVTEKNKCSGKCSDYKNGDVVRFSMCKLVVMVDFMCQLDWAAQVKHYFWASVKVLPDEISI